MRWIALMVILLILGAVIAGVVWSRPNEDGSCLGLGGDLVIPRGTTCAQNAIVIGGDMVVRGDVEGNAVAIGGAAQIENRVGGDVVTLGGEVDLLNGAQVAGDVTVLGGRLRRTAGSVVGGTLLESRLPLAGQTEEEDPSRPTAWTRIGAVVLTTALIFAGSLLLAVVLQSLWPTRTQTMIRTLRQHPLPSVGLGVASTFLLTIVLPLATLLLALILVGIPLIPFLYGLIGLLYAAGLSLCGIAVGEALLKIEATRPRRAWLPAAVGLLLLVPLAVLPPLLLHTLGLAWALLLASVGVGAILYSRAGLWAVPAQQG